MAGWKDTAEKLIFLTGGRHWLFSCASCTAWGLLEPTLVLMFE